jgi:hypothetical protein
MEYQIRIGPMHDFGDVSVFYRSRLALSPLEASCLSSNALLCNPPTRLNNTIIQFCGINSPTMVSKLHVPSSNPDECDLLK